MIMFTILIFSLNVKSLSAVTFGFETCSDWGSKASGTCTVATGKGALGAQTASAVQVKNGSLDYGTSWSGCPFQSDTCADGFAYYGWTTFFEYPNGCNRSHVIVSTPVFNVHLLGNGRLAVYVWLSNGTEYYAESVNPILLNVYYPIVVEFKKFATNNTWRLLLIAQDQLVGGATVGRSRTYTPPKNNLLFGGNGVNNESSGNVQFDHVTLDYATRDFQYYYQVLFDILTRQVYCSGAVGAQTRPLTCYWVQYWPHNWTEAYKSCQVGAYNYGFPYGRLAQFPSGNNFVWNLVSEKIAYWGNGSVLGYKAWFGAGANMTWLNETMGSLNYTVGVPKGVLSNTSLSKNTTKTCAFVNTQTSPWQWSEELCDSSHRYICQMSFDCILDNPCKNQGACLPINDGKTVCKCWPGTSGQFCEKGTIKPNCINNCSCSIPFGLKTTGRNCSECVDLVTNTLNAMQEFVLKMKLKLFEIRVDIEQVESWTSTIKNQLATITGKIFTNGPNAVSNNVDTIVESYDCSRIWQIYSKLLLYTKIYNKYIKTYLKRSTTGGLPNDMNATLTDIDNKLKALSNMSCFNESISRRANDVLYKPIVDYCNQVDQTDDYFMYLPMEEIKKVVNAINITGQNNTASPLATLSLVDKNNNTNVTSTNNATNSQILLNPLNQTLLNPFNQTGMNPSNQTVSNQTVVNPLNQMLVKQSNSTEFKNITERYPIDKNGSMCQITQEMWNTHKCIVLLV